MNHPKPLPLLSDSDIARFWVKVQINGPNECWPWTKGATHFGHGRFSIGPRGNQRTVIASRVAFYLTHGYDAGSLVCHNCDNPPCCNGAHLYEGTNFTNMQDRAARHPDSYPRGEKAGMRKHPERAARGEQAGPTRLTTAQVLEIRTRYITGNFTLTAIAADYGVTEATVRRLLSGETWHHLPFDPPDLKAIASAHRGHIGERNSSAKLTEAEVRVIRARYKAGGITQAALAREYHVTDVLISGVVRRKIWVHVN